MSEKKEPDRTKTSKTKSGQSQSPESRVFVYIQRVL